MLRHKNFRSRDLVRAIVVAVLAVIAGLLGRTWQPQGDAVDVATVEGRPRLVDGDSFFLGTREVRLEGIDAPEGRQTCRRNGAEVRCGEEAKRELQRLIGSRPITCAVDKKDQHGRLLSFCKSGDRDLNREMVENGFAVSFGSQYQAEERRARAAKRGLWAGEFERPSDWRRQNNNRG